MQAGRPLWRRGRAGGEFRADDRVLGPDVAIKVLTPEASNMVGRDAFDRRARDVEDGAFEHRPAL